VRVENDEVSVGRMLETYGNVLLRRSPQPVKLSKVFDASSSQADQMGIGQYWKPGMPMPEHQGPLIGFSQFMSFMQMCLLDKSERYEAAFVRFINRARLEPVTPELFEECFGKSVLALEKEVTEYEETMRFMKQARVKTIKGTLKYESLVLRDATDAEVGRIKGEALALMVAPKLSPRAMLRAPYVRGERDPRLLAAIGLHERKLGNDAEARRFLEVAVREKVDRPRAYVELARMRYQESLKTPRGADGKLDAAQLKPVMALLETARTVPPKIPEVYDLIAEVCAHSDVPTMRQLHLVDEGLQLFPYHAELFCQGAAAFAQAGRYKEAIKLIDHGLARFRYYEPTYGERLKQLQTALPPAAPEPNREPAPRRG
jgi:tetratricopeptide (TPR) repeat protein